MTIVHEAFHIFGFNDNFDINFQRVIQQPQNNFLNQYINVNQPFNDNNSHWNPINNPIDLMVPMARYDAIITIFSLQYLDNITPGVMTTSKY